MKKPNSIYLCEGEFYGFKPNKKPPIDRVYLADEMDAFLEEQAVKLDGFGHYSKLTVKSVADALRGKEAKRKMTIDETKEIPRLDEWFEENITELDNDGEGGRAYELKRARTKVREWARVMASSNTKIYELFNLTFEPTNEEFCEWVNRTYGVKARNNNYENWLNWRIWLAQTELGKQIRESLQVANQKEEVGLK